MLSIVGELTCTSGCSCTWAAVDTFGDPAAEKVYYP